MCGIAGVVRLDGIESEPTLEMSEMLAHRGPDDMGVYGDEYAALAHRRLSIIDLSSEGRQPLSNEDSTIHLTFNGEIYDYGVLRERLVEKGHSFSSHTDSEVLVHLFEDHQDEMLQHIDGMFAFAIWDYPRRRLFLARDQMGKKPLYYVLLKNGIAFASEMKALLALPEVSKEIDQEALHAYLVLGYVPDTLSILKDVRKLAPGSCAWFDDRGFRTERYFRPEITETKWTMDIREYDYELEKALHEAVRRRLVADVDVGLFLSGGIDSSLVASLIAEQTGRMKTFSIGFSEGAFDESDHALRVAQTLGSKHITSVVDAEMLRDTLPDVFSIFDEPFADASSIPTFLLARMTSQHVKVALGGDGADEIFGGYPTIRAQRWADRLSPVSKLQPMMEKTASLIGEGSGYYPAGYVMRRFASSFTEEPWRRQVSWTSYVSPDGISALLPGRSGLPDAVRALAADCAAPSSEITSRLLDQRLYLPDNILVKTDRASMGNSLEVRSPFLDKAVVSFANRLPRELTRDKVLLRRLLRKSPVSFVAKRSKKGFAVPISRWLRTDLKDWAWERLSTATEMGLSSGTVAELWNEHQERRRDRWRELWAIVVLAEWHDRWNR